MISSRRMPGAYSRRSVPRFFASVLAAMLLPCVACSREEPGRRTQREAALLYNQGKYAEALPLLRKAQGDGNQRERPLRMQ